ncbi:hypothetical protein FRB94_001021 [Tulasnella sp. JGI-2019a]|nr:hypothetical protein FRB94_001021 [Tulasnella sp. JGI-2019a]KAG9016883.1 hypothetical protein FRB93_009413 [Tulasnella sp. JGI-2019a]KAG9040219.1 hypothetical protein FRB95_000148 [Tulasnella sp. JGI-2019a]
MSTDLKTIQRQLKIKTGVVKRQIKELNLYRQEEAENVQKVEKLKAAAADGADIRHAETVLNEAKKMVPDAQGRTGKAVDDLKDLLAQATKIPELADDLDIINAKKALEQAEL